MGDKEEKRDVTENVYTQRNKRLKLLKRGAEDRGRERGRRKEEKIRLKIYIFLLLLLLIFDLFLFAVVFIIIFSFNNLNQLHCCLVDIVLLIV